MCELTTDVDISACFTAQTQLLVDFRMGSNTHFKKSFLEPVPHRLASMIHLDPKDYHDNYQHVPS
jgi:hypothetical protein